MNRKNPFTPIYVMCNSLNSKEKLVKLPPFPRYIDIELTNYCNFNCLMCPTGTHSTERKSGFMSDETFEKVLYEIREYKTPLRFIRWGEPMMHKNFLKFIKMARAAGSICHVNTNGSFLTDETMAEIIESGLESIKFSF